jgi:hypothetical protein
MTSESNNKYYTYIGIPALIIGMFISHAVGKGIPNANVLTTLCVGFASGFVVSLILYSGLKMAKA